MADKALQQNRDDVLRSCESVGCDLLKVIVRRHKNHGINPQQLERAF